MDRPPSIGTKITFTFWQSTFPKCSLRFWMWLTTCEAGHGKGGPDGVGGLLKNLADDAVAHEIDVHNLHAFYEVIQKSVKNVFLLLVSEESITEMDHLVLKGLKHYVGILCWCISSLGPRSKVQYFSIYSAASLVKLVLPAYILAWENHGKSWQ